MQSVVIWSFLECMGKLTHSHICISEDSAAALNMHALHLYATLTLSLTHTHTHSFSHTHTYSLSLSLSLSHTHANTLKSSHTLLYLL